MKLALRSVAMLAVLFGVATLWSGGNVLFGEGAAAAGNYVPFIVWFNFLAGFAYVAAGIGLWRGRAWAAALAGIVALLTGLAFLALGGYIAAGGAYEARTVAAMSLRTVVWIAITAVAWAGRKRIRAPLTA